MSAARKLNDFDPASKAAMLSVASNGALMVLKLTFALLFGSVALLGDGVDSAEDLVASALVFFSVRLALQPADEEHPFGHGKAESLAALSQAGLIAAGAVFIVVAAIRRLFADDHEIYVGPSLVAVGITAVVNLGVAGYAFRAARLTGSVAVRSDARHLMTNVVQAAAVGGALALVGITGNHVFDPIFALLLAAYLVWIAIGMPILPAISNNGSSPLSSTGRSSRSNQGLRAGSTNCRRSKRSGGTQRGSSRRSR